MTTKNLNTPQTLIIRLSEEILQRILRGEANLSSDDRLLRNHLELAAELNDPFLLGVLWNRLGTLHMYYGKFETAQDALLKSHDFYAAADSPENMLHPLSNLNFLYHSYGKPQEALQWTLEALMVIQRAPTDDLRSSAFVNSNAATTYLALGDMTQCEFHALASLALLGDQVHLAITPAAVAHINLAEVYLAKGNYQEAWSRAKLGYEYAQGVQDSIIMARAWFTQAHIAESDPTPAEPSATFYYAQAQKTVSAAKLRIMQARLYMLEARYHWLRDRQEVAFFWQKAATDIFTIIGATEEAELASKAFSTTP